MTDVDLGAYHRWLYKTAADLLPGGPGDPLLDDLVQEGRIAMWRALDTLPEDFQAVPMWITNAARARMRNIAWNNGQPTGHEAMRGSRECEVSSHYDAWEDTDSIGSPQWLPELSEPSLFDAINDLPDEQREYILLRFWGGLQVRADPGMADPVTNAGSHSGRPVQLIGLMEKYPVLKKRWVWVKARKTLAGDPRVLALRQET